MKRDVDPSAPRRLFRLLTTRRSLERDVDDEILFHLDERIHELIARGYQPAAARELAEREYGDVAASRKELTRLDQRRFGRERRHGLWDALRQDGRFAVRSLASRPGFSLAVVLTFGLGIGVNAAMFGVVDRLLFRAPPFLRDPAMVHRVYLAPQSEGREVVDRSLPYTRYLDLQRWTTKFSSAAAFAVRSTPVGEGIDATELRVAAVSARFFDFFAARPVLGRFFSASEDTVPAGATVVVLSHTLWQARFGGRPDAIGQTLRIGSVPYTIIGIAPEGFVGVGDAGPPALFIPITTYAVAVASPGANSYYTDYGWDWLEMLVRRRPGVSREAADADLTRAYVRSYEAQRVLEPSNPPGSAARPHAIAGPLSLERGPMAGRIGRVATWVSGVAVIVLLVACANVAHLLLTRVLGRQRELTMRIALGASRARVVAMLLTESLVLAILGGVVGVGAAEWGGAVLRTLFLPEGTAGSVLHDARTVLVVATSVALAGVVTGLAPALYVGREDVAGSLRLSASAGTVRRSAIRTSLLVFQAALCVLLLVGAGLFVRSVANVRALRLGFDVDPVLHVSLNLRGAVLSRVERMSLGERLEESARTMPEVQSASLGASVPLCCDWGQSFTVSGIDSVRRLGRFTTQASTGDYFRTLGTRIMRGRPITDADREDAAPVAVVSEGMARALWPGRDAIGQCIRIRDGRTDPPCTMVVGIAENIKQADLGEDQRLQFYLSLPQAQHPPAVGLFVRTRDRDARSHAEAIRRRLQPLMPGDGYLKVTPMRSIVDPRTQSWRLGATLFVGFGMLALLVAAVGLYAAIAYDVARRTREIGVRTALGARSRDVLGLVVGEAMRFAVMGILIGGAFALAVGRWLAPLLFDVSPTDPAVYGTVTIVLLLSAMAASAIPAMRAARVDPTVALRTD